MAVQAHPAPAAQTLTAAFPVAREMVPSIRTRGARIPFGGFTDAKDARTYIMRNRVNCELTSSDELALYCAQEESAVRFARAVECAGGTVWDMSYQGKGKGYRVECVIGAAWVSYMAARR